MIKRCGHERKSGRKRRGTKLCCSWDAKRRCACMSALSRYNPSNARQAQATIDRHLRIRRACRKEGKHRWSRYPIVRRSGCRSWNSRGLPFPLMPYQWTGYRFSETGFGPTILNEFSSSLICCASKGVSRLQVATSPRRSYSWLGHVS